MSAPPLTRVAVYRRSVAASLERVWENVHDWEHLPWLHGESFHHIDLLDSGRWGSHGLAGRAMITCDETSNLPSKQFGNNLGGPAGRRG